MNKNTTSLAALASLAHKALNAGGTEYTRVKKLISQFFHSALSAHSIEEVRLTLVDSLYSAKVVENRLFGITDIAKKLGEEFKNGDKEVKEKAAEWIVNRFDNANPLYGLFTAKYGVTQKNKNGIAAYSLLSKYLYFATDYSFPIYDSLGGKSFFIAGEKAPYNFQARFRVLQNIMAESGIDSFDKLDNLLWLYGKIAAGGLAHAFDKKMYLDLAQYQGKKSVADILKEVRAGKDPAMFSKIFGAALYEFIKETACFGTHS
jgi:hypothetical protein